jgi:uncharacterized protein YcfJ
LIVMTRAKHLILPVLVVLAAGLPAPAEAKSKAYCREWASDVADRHANGGDIVAGALIGAIGGALLGGAIDGHDGVGKGALIGGAGGAVLTGATANDRWESVYRLAYAECRAS